jgi:hypothetical protein
MLELVKGYKTVIFNVLIGLVMVWKAVSPESELPTPEMLSGLLDTLYASLEAILVVGNIVLRAVTDTAIGRKY